MTPIWSFGAATRHCGSVNISPTPPKVIPSTSLLPAVAEVSRDADPKDEEPTPCVVVSRPPFDSVVGITLCVALACGFSVKTRGNGSNARIASFQEADVFIRREMRGSTPGCTGTVSLSQSSVDSTSASEIVGACARTPSF